VRSDTESRGAVAGDGTHTLVPRYVEIERFLRERIAGAAVGDPLPSDAELCAQFGVSRMTARQAVQALAAEGLLVRRSGHGTFVAARPVHRRMGTLFSFTEDMERRGMTASSRPIALGWSEATPEERAELELGTGERVVLVHRVRLADGVPMAIERVALPPSCEAVLEADLETGSLHAELTRLGRVPTLARAWVTAAIATPEEAELLELPARGALLVERRIITDAGGSPIERTETRYASGRYVFDIELHRIGEEPTESPPEPRSGP
jgi:DNA-binding GntR family transcriptional regulator